MNLARWAPSLFVAVCAAGLPAQEGEPASKPTRLRFAWPVPARALVKHETEQAWAGARTKPNRSMRKRFMLEVTADEEEGVLRLERTAIEIVEVEGRDVSSPAAQHQLAPIVAQLMAAQPIVEVAKDGTFLGVEDWEAHLLKVEKALSALATRDVADGTMRLLRQPTFAQAAMQKMADPWNAWVGAWVDRELQSGDSITEEGLVQLGEVEVPQQVLVEHLGSEKSSPGLVRLQMTATMEGPEIAAAMQGALQEAMAAVPRIGEAKGSMPEANTEIRVISRVTLVTDPDTLRPAHVEMAKKIEMNIGGETSSRTDTERFDFEWQR
jgi:hypothetical protein